MKRRSYTQSRRLAETIGIALLLMISIGVSGKLALDTYEMDEALAKPLIIGGNLLLAYLLLRGYHHRHAGSEPPPLPNRQAAPTYTPEQQAYLANPSARAACRHLQAIEGLMRSQGIHAYPGYTSMLWADCRINEETLRLTLTLDACVSYSEYEDDRDRTASLNCSECKYSIAVRHPSLGGTWFPANQ